MTDTPAGRFEALAVVAAAEDNEITAHPFWIIVDPRQLMAPSVGAAASMVKGLFFSRESANAYIESHRYRYSSKVGVFCCSGKESPDYRALYDASRALRPSCQCFQCAVDRYDFDRLGQFIVCATCGNKRCPHATNHRHACTHSNDTDQPGSNYGDYKPTYPEDWTARATAAADKFMAGVMRAGGPIL